MFLQVSVLGLNQLSYIIYWSILITCFIFDICEVPWGNPPKVAIWNISVFSIALEFNLSFRFLFYPNWVIRNIFKIVLKNISKLKITKKIEKNENVLIFFSAHSSVVENATLGGFPYGASHICKTNRCESFDNPLVHSSVKSFFLYLFNVLLYLKAKQNVWSV